MTENDDGFVVTKETWECMPEKQKSWIMFETMQKVNGRLRALERWNKVFSTGGGMIGGALAWLAIRFLG